MAEDNFFLFEQPFLGNFELGRSSCLDLKRKAVDETSVSCCEFDFKCSGIFDGIHAQDKWFSEKKLSLFVQVYRGKHEGPHPLHGEKQVRLAAGIGAVDDRRPNGSCAGLQPRVLFEPFLACLHGSQVKALAILEGAEVFDGKAK